MRDIWKVKYICIYIYMRLYCKNTMELNICKQNKSLCSTHYHEYREKLKEKRSFASTSKLPVLKCEKRIKRKKIENNLFVKHARLYGCLNISSKMLLYIRTFSVPQRGIGSSDKSTITVY